MIPPSAIIALLRIARTMFGIDLSALSKGGYCKRCLGTGIRLTQCSMGYSSWLEEERCSCPAGAAIQTRELTEIHPGYWVLESTRRGVR